MKRAWSLVIVLLGIALAAGLGWMAASNIRSPTQVALETQPPQPSLITVEVERTELVADVITRADIGYDDPVFLSLSGSLGGVSTSPIVTSARQKGDEIVEGEVAVEVSGRPVFLLEGDIPVYRDLLPQAEGPDVLQFESALHRLGYLSEDPDEVWTPATETAVEAWYGAAGYQANGLSEAEQQQLDAAEEAVTLAEKAVESARDRQSDAEDRLDLAIRQEENARYDLAEAEDNLKEAGVGPDPDDVRRARAALTSAEESAMFVELDVDRTLAAARRAIIDAEAHRERTAVSYTRAVGRWESARMGVHPDTGSPPTGADLESLRQEADIAEAELETAERLIVEAYQDLDRREVETNATLRDASDGLADAQSALNDLLEPPDLDAQERAVEAAGQSLDDASAAIETARSAIEDARADLEDARENVKTAQEDLAELEAELGTWVPAGEVIFLERLPVRVDLVTADTGSIVSGSFMTVTGSKLAIRGSVSDTDVALVREEGVVFIDDPLLVEPLPGEIREVADRPGTNNVASSRYYLEIIATDIPDDLVGSNVKVVIPVGGTAGEVLAVPAAALSATADGSSRVEVQNPDETTRFIRVEPGLSADGLVEITPLDGEITEGDLVVVGVAS